MKQKKTTIFLVALVLLCGCADLSAQSRDPWVDYVETSRNPVVQRISSAEINANATPAAVAYNFVKAILNYDFDAMLRNATPDYKADLQAALANEYGGDKKAIIRDNFSKGKLGILSWIPALSQGYEEAVAFIQDESYYIEDGTYYTAFNKKLKGGKIYLPGESTPRPTQIVKKIYITCSPSSEIGDAGFQDITRYGDTNVKPLVFYLDGKWKVGGFK